jgi:hypothetical protein
MRRLVGCARVSVALGGCLLVEPREPPGLDPGPVYAPGPPASDPPPRIPPSHLPPPGSCRIWFPDGPPGHQPPPGPCERLQYQVPPGAYLIRG